MAVTEIHYLFDREHHDGGDDGDTNAGQDAQGRAPDELIGVLQSFLEGGDGEEGQVLLLLSIPHQIHVHQLLDLHMTGHAEGINNKLFSVS